MRHENGSLSLFEINSKQYSLWISVHSLFGFIPGHVTDASKIQLGTYLNVYTFLNRTEGIVHYVAQRVRI